MRKLSAMVALITCLSWTLQLGHLESHDELDNEVQKISEIAGYRIAENLESPLGWYDLNAVVDGMQAYIAKKTMLDIGEPIDRWNILYKLFERLAVYNLEKANSFLCDLSTKPGVTVLEGGKVMYEILKEGTGDTEVINESDLLVSYAFSTLDGLKIEFEEQVAVSCKISVDEVIPGFAMGVIGMRQGEKRKLYIHPDLAYGTTGAILPNSLLIAEVEVISLHSSTDRA